MAKGITNRTKFIRAVLAREIGTSENYTIGTAAGVIAFLRRVSSEMLADDWIERVGVGVPKEWRTPQGEYGYMDAAKNHTEGHKAAMKYGRKFLHRDLERSDCPFKRVINPEADNGDGDFIIMKPASEC